MAYIIFKVWALVSDESGFISQHSHLASWTCLSGPILWFHLRITWGAFKNSIPRPPGRHFKSGSLGVGSRLSVIKSLHVIVACTQGWKPSIILKDKSVAVGTRQSSFASHRRLGLNFSLSFSAFICEMGMANRIVFKRLYALKVTYVKHLAQGTYCKPQLPLQKRPRKQHIAWGIM